MPEFEPSDWKNTAIPKLAQLDSLQRCLICKDFLKAPVITSCNHTFCSQCIRQHLMSVSRCPLCKAEQFESNLKRVILLEELVLCFQSLREDLMSLVTSRDHTSIDPPPINKKTNPDSAYGGKVEIIEIPDETGSPPVDGQKLDPGYVQCPVCAAVMKEEHAQGSHLDYCLNGKPDPALVSITPAIAKRKSNDVRLFFQTQKRQKQAANPVDHEKFYFNQDDNHHHHESKRIPKIDFASLSTAKVKEKLAAHKLSVQGSRAELEWRYNHYYLLHHSNLDSNHSLSDMELRQKLKQWEISHLAAPAPVASNTIYGDTLSRKCISDKDFPIKAWLELYKDEFTQLVKHARKSQKERKKLKNKETHITTENVENGEKPTDHVDSHSTIELELSRTKPGENKDALLENHKSTEQSNPKIIDDPEMARAFDFTKSTLFPLAPE